MEKRRLDLKSADEIFTTESERQDEQRERVSELPLSTLHPFENHPFHVLDDEQMAKTVESVAQYGVLVPILVRPKESGGYEIVSGHRRSRAAELAGLTTIPAIVRDMTDDEAIIVMVDSNLQRETILPSEKAFAYKMKLEAMKRQGARTDLTSSQLGMKLDRRQALDFVGETTGDSRNTVHRYIRLTNLIPELLSEVDQSRIGLSPAVELSFIPESEQLMLLSAIEYAGTMPSMAQAKQIRNYSTAGKITPEVLEVIMNAEQVKQPDTIRLKPSDTVRKTMKRMFGDLSAEEMSTKIMNILESWAKAQERRKDR